VILANLLSLTVNLIVFASTGRDTEWVKGRLLVVPALLTVPLGAVVARTMPPAPLMVVIGLLVILALGAVVLSPRARVLRGRRGAVGAGAASLFMNVTAGVGGPAIVPLYGHHRLGAPQVRRDLPVLLHLRQPHLAARQGRAPQRVRGRPRRLGVALVVGLACGQALARRVDPTLVGFTGPTA